MHTFHMDYGTAILILEKKITLHNIPSIKCLISNSVLICMYEFL
jgi:hypothetical protein